MRAVKRQGSGRRSGHAARTAALIIALVISACLAVASVSDRCPTAGGSTGHAWLGWFSLIPLFLVIRLWRPTGAMLAGGLWGICLYVFSVGQPDAPVASTVQSLLLLAGPPAIYAYLGARLTRWIGFNPFVLGVAWMGVELALGPAGLRIGPLGGTSADGTFLHWVSQALGYTLAAFLIALVSASLASVLGGGRLRIVPLAYRIASRDPGASLMPQTFFCLPLFAIRPSRPRGPPITRA